MPFRTILNFFRGGHRNAILAINNILGNIVVLIPLGIYSAVLRKNKGFLLSLFGVFSISFLFELLQFVFARGASDIDDIILNCVGGLIGILGYKCLAYFQKTEEKARSTVAILAACIGIPVFVFIMADIVRMHAAL